MTKAIARIGVLLVLLAVVLPFSFYSGSTSAQGTNLLENGNMNGNFYGLPNNKGQAPRPWTVWANGEIPINDYHQFVVEVRSAPGSWVQRCAYLACTAGGRTKIGGLTKDKVYRFTIYAFLWTCKNEGNLSCRDAEGRWADEESNARVRVGVDPTGGDDPNASTVYWSAFSKPWLAFQALSIDVKHEGRPITLFTYWTSDVPMQFNEVYWDDGSFEELPDGQGNPVNGGGTSGGGNINPTAAPPSAVVPFVRAQRIRQDGSIIHIVRENDTFYSIAVAYRDLVSREDILEFNGWDLPPSIISVGQEIIIVPPGTLDPTTGQVLNPAGSIAPPAAPPQNTTTDGSTGTTGTAPTPPPPPQIGGSTTGPTPPIVPSTTTNNNSSSGEIGPGTPTIDPDVEKGGSLLPGTSPHLFMGRVTRPYERPRVSFGRRPAFTPRLHQTASTGRVCVSFFEDTNSDLLQNRTEASVIGGAFTLAKQSYTLAEPDTRLCLDDVSAGETVITATAPTGYGFLGSPVLNVLIYPERETLVKFSVLPGFSIPDSPPAEAEAPLQNVDLVPVIEDTATVTADDSLMDQLIANSAWFVFASAGFIGIFSLLVVWSYRR
jgi:hypothetical protein